MSRPLGGWAVPLLAASLVGSLYLSKSLFGPSAPTASREEVFRDDTLRVDGSDSFDSVDSRKLAEASSQGPARSFGVTLLFFSIGTFVTVVGSLHLYGHFLFKDPETPESD
eukprot:TRINITY_DN43087_c0_g1_i3.p1 TRINITY_DN43087_c0_g1~~TRINITY_DN43087_c0_g1_i3.p1  ORF type:complete len:111 (-),score=7.21 TRINITY_DN43087_c0_g1_i3:83-415(-)